MKNISGYFIIVIQRCGQGAAGASTDLGVDIEFATHYFFKKQPKNVPHDRTGKRSGPTQMQRSMLTVNNLKMPSFSRSAVYAVVKFKRNAISALLFIMPLIILLLFIHRYFGGISQMFMYFGMSILFVIKIFFPK
jgi:hypothetical protein